MCVLVKKPFHAQAYICTASPKKDAHIQPVDTVNGQALNGRLVFSEVRSILQNPFANYQH